MEPTANMIDFTGTEHLLAESVDSSEIDFTGTEEYLPQKGGIDFSGTEGLLGIDDADRTWGESLEDKARYAATGANSMVGGMAWLGEKASNIPGTPTKAVRDIASLAGYDFDPMGEAAEAIQKQTQSGQDYWREGLSEHAKGNEQKMAEADGVIGTLGALVENPEQIPDLIAGSLAYLVPGAGASRVGAIVAGARAATGAGIVTNGLLEGADAAVSAEEFVKNATPENLKDSWQYQALLDKTGSHEEALAQLVNEAGLKAFVPAATISMLASKVSGAGKLEADFFTGGAKTGLVKSIGKEAAEEATQEIGNQIGANYGSQGADNSISLTDDIGKAGTLGAALGVSQGGSLKAASATANLLSKSDPYAGPDDPGADHAELEQADTEVTPPPEGFELDALEREIASQGEAAEIQQATTDNDIFEMDNDDITNAEIQQQIDISDNRIYEYQRKASPVEVVEGFAESHNDASALPAEPSSAIQAEIEESWKEREAQSVTPEADQLAIDQAAPNHVSYLAAKVRGKAEKAAIAVNNKSQPANPAMANAMTEAVSDVVTVADPEISNEIAALEQVVASDKQGRTAPAVPSSTVSDNSSALEAIENNTPPASEATIKPAGNSFDGSSLDIQANEAATSPLNDRPEPTEGQKEAGNYKKGRIKIQGLDIAIENPKGSTRKGTDPDGKEWENEIHHHYGDITGTKGADGDALDVFIGPNEQSEKVFAIDQINKDGSFDEHKIMLGFDNKTKAIAGYKKNYDKGWKVGPTRQISTAQLREWIKNGDTTKPIAKADIAETVGAGRPEGSNLLFSRKVGGRSSKALKKVTDPNGRKVHQGAGVMVIQGKQLQVSESDFDEGNALDYGHLQHVEPGAELWEMSALVDGQPAAKLIVQTQNGDTSAIHDIKVIGRGAGKGEAVVSAILASAKSDVKIIEAIPSAQGFWDKMGANGFYDPYNNTTISWNDYEQARPRRKEQGSHRGAHTGKSVGGQNLRPVGQGKAGRSQVARKLPVGTGAVKDKKLDSESSDYLTNYLNGDDDLTFSKSSLLPRDATPTGIPFRQAELYVKNFLKTYSGADDGLILRVHRTQEAWLGESSREEIGRVKGGFDSARNELHAVAANHDNTADLRHTLQHEIFVHKGLGLFSPEVEKSLISAITENAPKSKSLAPVWRSVQQDYHDQSKAIQAEEVMARLAERDLSKFDRFLNKIILSIKNALQSMGIAKPGISREALIDQIYKIAEAFKQGRKARQRKFSVEDESNSARLDQNLKRERPAAKKSEKVASVSSALDTAVSSKDTLAENDSILFSRETIKKADGTGLAAALESGDKANIKKAISKLDNFKSKHWSKLLGAIGRRYLADFAEPGMTSVKSYIRMAQRMDADRNQLLSESASIVDRWTKWASNRKSESNALANAMHEATIAGYDPSEEYIPLITAAVVTERTKVIREKAKGRSGEGTGKFIEEIKQLKNRLAQERNRAEAKPFIDKLWSQLGEEGRQLYKDARDHYSERREQMFQTLQDRINRAEGDEGQKGKLQDLLRDEFESQAVEGPYFPLSRFGDYWAVAKNDDGSVAAFSLFENLADQSEWAIETEKAGFIIDSGRNSKQKSMEQQVDPAFASKVTGMVSGLGGPTANGLADDIWQMYLQSLPAMSARKHFIHRKKTRGFSRNAIRGFSKSNFHMGHQLAKLRYADLMEAELDALNEQAKVAKRQDLAMPLYDEMKMRHEWAMNPQGSALANNLTSLGFAWYLGATPAAALVNITQTPMVALPVMGAKHGFTKAAAALSKASSQILGPGGISKKLKGQDLEAYNEFLRAGVIDKTQAHDLAGIGESENEYSPVKHKIMSGIAFLFHKAEQWNREITAMAGYRLAKADGMSHEEAILHAEDMVWDSHFDYSNANRPRYLQNDAAKVFLLFKQHSLNMTYRLWRDLHDSVKSESKEVRVEARKRFAGMIGTTAIFAGASGLPLFSLAMGIGNFLDEIGDEDDPTSFETDVRVYMAEAFGGDVADVIWSGAANKATGLNIASRVSLNNLWLRDPNRPLEGGEKFWHYGKEMAGPMPSILANAAEGVSKISEGHHWRGVEKLLPKAARDILKSIRFHSEGVLNYRGDAIMEKGQLNNYEVIAQLTGFSPTALSKQYELKGAKLGAANKLKERRYQLLNSYYIAAKFGDKGDPEKVIESIVAYNDRNPQYPITTRSLKQSVKMKYRRSAESNKGLYLNQRLRYLDKQINF